MMHTKADRRRYLATALSGLAVLGLGGWAWQAEASEAASADAAHANLLRLAAQTPAAVVGAAVLPQLAHTTPQALVASLGTRLAGFLEGNLHQPCDTSQLHLAFQAAIQDDFAQGRCVSVSGWVLARSEVELCALAALSAPSA